MAQSRHKSTKSRLKWLQWIREAPGGGAVVQVSRQDESAVKPTLPGICDFQELFRRSLIIFISLVFCL